MPASTDRNHGARRPDRLRLSAATSRRQILLLLSLGLLLGALVGLAWTSADSTQITSAAPLETPTPTVSPGSGGVAGTVWQDTNGDGTFNPGEAPLPGTTVALYNQAGDLLLTVTTQTDGDYRFQPLSPGTYQVAATPPSGYHPTTPASLHVYIGPGIILTLDFGAQFVPSPTPTATPIPKIDVDSATFATCGGIAQNDTRSGSNRVSRYSCQPAWDESGPEMVYRVELGRSQLLSATFLTNTVDLDLFLLTSAFPDSCLAGGDNYISQNVGPGIYFLVVDGYKGAKGPFSLRLECPLSTQATPTSTPTSSPTATSTTTPTPSVTPTPSPTKSTKWRYVPLILQKYTGAIPETATLVFQQGTDGYAGTADTTLSAWETGTNFGGADLLRLRYNKGSVLGTDMAPLLRFDLALLPSDAHIVTASLNLYLAAPPKYDLRGEVHGLLRTWDEMTATWLLASSGAPWTRPGAQGIDSDFMSWAADNQPIGIAKRWYSFDVTDLVRIWVSDPVRNNGLMVMARGGESDSNVEAGFASREQTNAALRPRLSVTYWVSAGAAGHR